MKKKMDDFTKAKLIYSVELAVFGVAFLTLAILKMVGVIPQNDKLHIVFNWITLFGGSWIVADFIWALLDKKRRKRIALIDKILHLPVGIYLIAYDLFCLISKPTDERIYQFGIPSALAYLSICYVFEAIYHYKYPIPGLLDAIKEEEKKEDSSLEESEKKKDE